MNAANPHAVALMTSALFFAFGMGGIAMLEVVHHAQRRAHRIRQALRPWEIEE